VNTTTSSTSAGTSIGSADEKGVYDEPHVNSAALGADGIEQSSASLREELASLKADLDALLGKASSLTDREFRLARDQLMIKFGSMRYAAKGLAAEASKQFNNGVECTTGYVKEKPLQSVAMAAGVGLLFGALMRGR
jgi:ElaB/YqjD/DUF883 family membrane-anchored ribosome-binding protein